MPLTKENQPWIQEISPTGLQETCASIMSYQPGLLKSPVMVSFGLRPKSLQLNGSPVQITGHRCTFGESCSPGHADLITVCPSPTIRGCGCQRRDRGMAGSISLLSPSLLFSLFALSLCPPTFRDLCTPHCPRYGHATVPFHQMCGHS